MILLGKEGKRREGRVSVREEREGKKREGMRSPSASGGKSS